MGGTFSHLTLPLPNFKLIENSKILKFDNWIYTQHCNYELGEENESAKTEIWDQTTKFEHTEPPKKIQH